MEAVTEEAMEAGIDSASSDARRRFSATDAAHIEKRQGHFHLASRANVRPDVVIAPEATVSGVAAVT